MNHGFSLLKSYINVLYSQYFQEFKKILSRRPGTIETSSLFLITCRADKR